MFIVNQNIDLLCMDFSQKLKEMSEFQGGDGSGKV